MSDLFELGKCEKCGNDLAKSDLKTYKGNMYCKSCLKLVKPKRKSKAKSASRTATSRKKGTAEPIVGLKEALIESIDKVLTTPLKVELGTVKLEIVNPDALTTPISTMQQPTGILPNDQITASRGSHPIDELVLRVMGRKKRKWRPKELLNELLLIETPAGTKFVEEDVRDALDRLIHADRNVPDNQRVVQLTSRYMRRDFFMLEDELGFLDLAILQVLNPFLKDGLPATIIHEIIRLFNLGAASMPTVLNHLRTLKSPGWDLIEKVGDSMRDNYSIMGSGSHLLNDILWLIEKSPNIHEAWARRLRKWKILDKNNKTTKRADIFILSPSNLIKTYASIEDKALLIKVMEGTIPYTDNASKKRTLQALEILTPHLFQKVQK